MKKTPNYVGKTLSRAKRDLPWSAQCVILDHKNRKQDPFFSSDWKVCKQEPAAGANFAGYMVFTIIRSGETCTVSH